MKSSLMLVAGLLVSTFAVAAHASDGVDLVLNAAQSTSFNKASKDSFGHIISLTVGSTELKADMTAENPTNKRRESAVGIMTAVEWDRGLKSPMKFKFNVSTANKMKLKALMKTVGESTPVEIDFQVYSQDPAADMYYIAFKSFTIKEKGFLNKTAKTNPKFKFVSFPLSANMKRSALSVADGPYKEVATPVSFPVEMSLTPGGKKQQDVMFATSSESAEQIHWGAAN